MYRRGFLFLLQKVFLESCGYLSMFITLYYRHTRRGQTWWTAIHDGVEVPIYNVCREVRNYYFEGAYKWRVVYDCPPGTLIKMNYTTRHKLLIYRIATVEEWLSQFENGVDPVIFPKSIPPYKRLDKFI